ncbi:Gldg family protein [Sphingobium nicotianae]|uniref:Gldg family protein n=1 Tax=Sphingobium nicotianae TaxID=2782607 RepID=A0A9X1IS58_9SPHN|nr:Gldg family protein [Sphingobium nicotianae]MBT2188009.1 Gldg family protein [Sphingobium nicotianae]
MARVLISALILFLIAGAALLLGLAGTALHTGRIDPFDWLLPGAAAILCLRWYGGRSGWRSAAIAWTLVMAPTTLLILLVASRQPWFDLAMLGGALAGIAAAAGWAFVRAASLRRPSLVLLSLLVVGGREAMLLASRDSPQTPSAGRPAVGVISALPLYGAALAPAGQTDMLRDTARTTPIWDMLGRDYDLRPIDHLDPAALTPFRRLLIAQPRQLAPTELVALDGWVRGGGYALVLADPLLGWPDPRPLGDPRRTPLTSLLDPLLTHWGLQLEPARGGAVERRILKSGALLQMTGASRFTRLARGDARCELGEEGLIARCVVGRGHVRLIADADWIDDRLWTFDPTIPHDRAAWTSDAVPALRTWLRPDSMRVDSPGIWLVDQNRLISALRWAFLLLLLLVAAWAVVKRLPTTSHMRSVKPPDQKRNIGGLKADSR